MTEYICLACNPRCHLKIAGKQTVMPDRCMFNPEHVSITPVKPEWNRVVK